MPFTLAHPAAAIPLRRPLGRHGVLSALVIGSMTPDFSYFLPFHITRLQSHSPGALLWFCLPTGGLSYLLFHTFFKGPLLGLMPTFVIRRLGDDAWNGSPPSVPWFSVVGSLLAGAVTHLAWDAFTHENGPAVTSLPALHVLLFHIRAHPVYLYRVLQHGSTVTGLALLAWWTWRWVRRTPVTATSAAPAFSLAWRVGIVGAIAAASVIVGLCGGWHALRHPDEVLALRDFAGRVAVWSLRAVVLALAAYSAGWHLLRRRERFPRPVTLL